MSSKVKKVDSAPVEKLNAWKVAQQQLRNVAELINLDEDLFGILSTPRVCMTVSVPIRHDDGRIRVYYGAADTTLAAADFSIEEILANIQPC